MQRFELKFNYFLIMSTIRKSHDVSIQTTMKEFEGLSGRIRKLGVSPNTPIEVRVMALPDIDSQGNMREGAELHLPFLDNDIWDAEGAHDVAKNHDQYLYDAAEPHAQK